MLDAGGTRKGPLTRADFWVLSLNNDPVFLDCDCNGLLDPDSGSLEVVAIQAIANHTPQNGSVTTPSGIG